MCSDRVINFVENALKPEEIRGKNVLEIGSRFVNGTVRWTVEQHEPSQYWGIDMFPGPCVDEVCTIEETYTRFAPESFDIVISTEMLEHVLDFRVAIKAIKRVCKRGGIIILTTRSKGFKLHGDPYDFWRFETTDMQALFSDCTIEQCCDEGENRFGVFLKAIKGDTENNIDDYSLYSMVYESIMQCDTEKLNAYIEKSRPSQYGTVYKNFFSDNVELFDLGARRNTDKTKHGYLPTYEFFLKKFKNDTFNLLELGVFKGSSTAMWHDYFPNAHITGVDIRTQCKKFEKERLEVKILDLACLESYTKLADKKYRVIIDDASHIWSHQILSFLELFRCVESGGIYIIEDLHTSFHPLAERYNGGLSASCADVLLAGAEVLLSCNTSNKLNEGYKIYIDAISKQMDMVSFIQKSCIVVKK